MHHNLPRWCVSDMPHFYVSSFTHFSVSVTLLQSHHQTHHPFCHAPQLATLVCFQLTTFFLCPHWHIFLCPCHCYRSLILGSLPTPVVVLVPSPVAHVMSFIGRWILLGHGWRRKSNLIDPVVRCWIQPWCQMTAQFLWWDQFLSESLLMCSNATGRIY